MPLKRWRVVRGIGLLGERLGEALTVHPNGVDAIVAAGLLPKDVGSPLSSEPVIGEVLELLQDEAVPAEYRENVREQLKLIAAQAGLELTGRAS